MSELCAGAAWPYRWAMASFVPCPRCHRHVRSTEASCVFCGVGRTSQAAALLSVAALALGGCDPKPMPDLPSTPATSASAPALPGPSAEPAPSSVAVTPSATATADTPPPVAPIASGVGAQDPPPRPAMRYGIAPRK
jgi:hypothetical protein